MARYKVAAGPGNDHPAHRVVKTTNPRYFFFEYRYKTQVFKIRRLIMSILRSIHNVWDTVCYEVGGIGYKPKRKQHRDQHRGQHGDQHRGHYQVQRRRSSGSLGSFQSDYNRHRHQR